MSSEVVSRAGQEAVTSDPTTTPTPTPTHYQQVAARMSAALAEMVAQMPELQGEQPSTSDFVRTKQNVSIPFIETVAAAVDASPELQALKRFDVQKALDVVQYVQAFRPLYDQVTAFARSLKFSMDVRRAPVARDALQIFSIAKGVARDPASTAIASHVKNMRRDFRRKPRAKGTGDGSPGTPPAAAKAA